MLWDEGDAENLKEVQQIMTEHDPPQVIIISDHLHLIGVDEM
jgi:hypothetical protein